MAATGQGTSERNEIHDESVSFSDDETQLKTVQGELPPTTSSVLITDITAFQGVSDDAFSEAFLSNLDLVFQYSKTDVICLLESRKIVVLDSLRSKLAELSLTLFDELKDRILCNRKIKSTYAGDIFLLGYSVANKSLASDIIDKVLVNRRRQNVVVTSTPQNDSLQVDESSSLPDLIKCVANLRVTVSKLQKEIQEVNTRYNQLSESVRAMGTISTTCRAKDDAIPSGPSVGGTRANEVEGGATSQPIGTPQATTSQPSSDPESSDDDYQYQRNEKRRKRKKTKSPESLRASSQTPVKSTPESVSSAGATEVLTASKKVTLTNSVNNAKNKDIYLGNLNVNSSEKAVCSHLQTYNIKISPSDVKLLSHRRDNKSFKVSLPEVHYMAALSKDHPIWPKGVKVRPFYPNNNLGRRGTHPSGLQAAPSSNNNNPKNRAWRNANQSGRPDRRANRPNEYSINRRSRWMDEAEWDTEWPRLQRPTKHHESYYDELYKCDRYCHDSQGDDWHWY